MNEKPGVPRQAARQMMREAVSRGLVPGDRLASEKALMGFFKISRGSLREALRLLSFLGAIEVRTGPGGGARLALPRAHVVASALAMAVQMRGSSLRSVLEASMALEPVVAGLAATHRDDRDLALLDASLARLASSAGTDHFVEESRGFRHCVATACGNDVLGLVVDALMAMSTSLGLPHPPKAHERVVAESVAIAMAIRSRDSTMAGEVTSAMLENLLADLDADHPAQLAARIQWADVDQLCDQKSSEKLVDNEQERRKKREGALWTR